MSKITRYYATLNNTTPIAIVEENSSVFEFLNKLDDITISGTAISGVFRDYLLKRHYYDQTQYSEIEMKNFEIAYALLFKSIDELNFKDNESSNQSMQSKKLFLGLIAETTKNYQPLAFFDMMMNTAETEKIRKEKKTIGKNKSDYDIYKYRNRVMINRKTSVAVDGGLFKERLIKADLVFDFAMEFKHLCEKSFPILPDEILKKKLNEKKFLDRYKDTSANDNNDEAYKIKINLYEYEIIKKYKDFTTNFKAINQYIQIFIDDFAHSIHNGETHLTGKSNLGYGQFEAKKWTKKDFDLAENLDEYLKLESVYDGTGFEVRDLDTEANHIKSINVKCDGGLIITEDNYKFVYDFDDKDNKLLEKKVAIIPSSTIKGIVRSNFERIAATKEAIAVDMFGIGLNNKNSSNDADIIKEIFGYTNEYFVKQVLIDDDKESNNKKDQDTSIKNEKEERSSKKGIVRFYDVEISGFETQETTNVKIDRFTGGAYTGGIKDFKRLVPKKDFVIEIKYFVDPYADPLLKECFDEYLDYFLMDIRDGLVSIGSNESTGYGMLTLA